MPDQQPGNFETINFFRDDDAKAIRLMKYDLRKKFQAVQLRRGDVCQDYVKRLNSQKAHRLLLRRSHRNPIAPLQSMRQGFAKVVH